MKKSSLYALIGVGLLVLNNLYYFFANTFNAWQYEWYSSLSFLWSIIAIAGWVLIGQFFYKLYKKSK